MKKIVVLAFAMLSSAALVISCQKEQSLESDNEKKVSVESNIPETITAHISEDVTKTSYDADGKFSWVNNDAIRLVVVQKGSTTGSPQGFSTYYATNLSNSNRTAEFENSGNNIIDFTSGDWESTGIAIYPIRMARPHSGSSEGHGYGKPFVTIPEQGNPFVSGLASEIILTGVEMNDHSNFKFSTAMAVLKITVKNIPAEAQFLVLYTNDKTNYPIDGDFVLEKNSEGLVVFTPEQHQDYNNSPTGYGYLAVDLSKEGVIESRDFYFNVPVANYPAGTFSISIQDNTQELFGKTINKELKLNRNDCLTLPTLVAGNIRVDKNAVSPRLTYANDKNTIIRVHISQTQLTATTYDNSVWKEGNKFSNPSGTYDLYYLTGTGGDNDYYLTTTGTYYLNYLVLNSSDTSIPATLTSGNVKSYGSIPFYYLDKGSSRINLAECTVTASSTEEYEGALEYLWDGTGNFWHSVWYQGTHNYSADYGVYIDVALPSGKELSKFQFLYQIRSDNNNGRPREVVYGYSNDGTTWTKVGNAVATSAMDADAGTWVHLPYVELTEPVKYLRFGITKSGDGASLTDGSGSTALSELELYGE